MTDRTNYLTVILEKPVRTDDIESTVEAIKHIRGVLDVKVNVDGADLWAREQVKAELREKLWNVLND